MARFLQEPSKNDAARQVRFEVELDDMATRGPALWEHLSETRWESGSARTTSTLTIFVEDGLVKLCLRDRSGSRTAWVSGKSLLRAWDALEVGLQNDTVEWRRDRPGRK